MGLEVLNKAELGAINSMPLMFSETKLEGESSRGAALQYNAHTGDRVSVSGAVFSGSLDITNCCTFIPYSFFKKKHKGSTVQMELFGRPN